MMITLRTDDQNDEEVNKPKINEETKEVAEQSNPELSNNRS